MAARAVDAFRFPMHVAGVNVLRDRGMAMPARGLRYSTIEVCDLNNVWISASGEIKRMEKTVARLDGIFSQYVVRSVTVIAGGRRMMA